MFGLSKKKDFFTAEEKQRIVETVRIAEQNTSGEIRVFVESKCKYVDALDRAAEIFFGLEMDETELRNAVLVYVATKDKQVAVFGDEGIFERVEQDYWQAQVTIMLAYFNNEDFAEGITQSILRIGDTLKQQFPFNRDTDKNELPDDIVFGN